MTTVHLLLGSNEGDRQKWLRQCMDQLEQSVGNITQISQVYETAAWGLEDQPDFLNMAVAVLTELDEGALLDAIQNIEKSLGRQRELKWGQRTLDIDILLWGGRIIDRPNLQIPHPYLPQRRFALAPLAEIASEMIHPIFNKTIAQLLEACKDPLEVHSKGFLPAF